MASKLADELLQMILSPSLKVPHEQLISPSTTAFGRNDAVSSASTLLVCKRWLRVATPLLYETVIIRSSGQAYALAEALRLNPTFPERVKKIRLEGSYVALDKILASCKKLSTLVILLRIYSDANVAGLCRALPLIDPTEIILYDEGQIDNIKVRRTLIALCDAIPTWKNLITLEIPYNNQGQGNAYLEPNFTRRTRLFDAVKKSTSLRVITCELRVAHIGFWQPIAETSTIKIRFRYDLLDPWQVNCKQKVLEDIISNNLLPPSSFEFVDLTIPPPITETRKQTQLDHNPSFSFPSVDSVPFDIWEIIFIFATTPSSPCAAASYPCAFQSITSRNTQREYNAIRTNLSVVCKKFARIIIPLMFKFPMIPSAKSLGLFMETVLRTPHIGRRVHVISISGLRLQKPSADVLCSLLPHLTCLRHFIIFRGSPWGGMVTLSTKELILLAQAAGNSLLSMTLDFRSDTVISPIVLSSFKKLITMDIHFPSTAPVVKTSLQTDSLETLRELRYSGSPSFLDILSGLRLPNLRTVVFKKISGPTVENFMKTCGSQVQELDFNGSADFACILQHAPHLHTLRWEPHGTSWLKCSELVSSSLTYHASHGKLRKFKVKGIPDTKCGEKEQSNIVRTFFDSLQVANFPGLQEIQFESYCWPLEERAIQKDLLPNIAVRVKQEYSVDIKDSSGKTWRPRVQRRR